MKTIELKRTRCLGLLLTWALLAPAVALAGADIDEVLDMPADGRVVVENLAGSVEFVTWDESRVQIRGEAGDDVEDVEISSNANGVEIRVRNRENRSRIDETDLYLKIPRGASIDGEGVSTDFTISDCRGESITLNSVSGDLEVEAKVGRIELSTVSGDIEFDGAAVRTSAESVSGDITLVGVSGEIRASVVSGDLSLEAEEVDRARFEAVSGETTLDLELADGGRLKSDSMSGDVYLQLPGSQQASFTAQSFSGSINTDFGDADRGKKGPGEMLHHREGDNGAEIRIETFSGDVSIRKR
jgi:DUF4097 and DUF4098 domain-containing protein YvlB